MAALLPPARKLCCLIAEQCTMLEGRSQGSMILTHRQPCQDLEWHGLGVHPQQLFTHVVQRRRVQAERNHLQAARTE
jgi:hypothetical protein